MHKHLCRAASVALSSEALLMEDIGYMYQTALRSQACSRDHFTFFSHCQAAFGGDLDHESVTWWMKPQPTAHGRGRRRQGNPPPHSAPQERCMQQVWALPVFCQGGKIATGIFVHTGSIHVSPEGISAHPFILTWKAFSEVSEIISMIKGRYLN